jgi:hypothetical protein
MEVSILYGIKKDKKYSKYESVIQKMMVFANISGDIVRDIHNIIFTTFVNTIDDNFEKYFIEQYHSIYTERYRESKIKYYGIEIYRHMFMDQKFYNEIKYNFLSEEYYFDAIETILYEPCIHICADELSTQWCAYLAYQLDSLSDEVWRYADTIAISLSVNHKCNIEFNDEYYIIGMEIESGDFRDLSMLKNGINIKNYDAEYVRNLINSSEIKATGLPFLFIKFF